MEHPVAVVGLKRIQKMSQTTDAIGLSSTFEGCALATDVFGARNPVLQNSVLKGIPVPDMNGLTEFINTCLVYQKRQYGLGPKKHKHRREGQKSKRNISLGS
jgi:hypothetical protein